MRFMLHKDKVVATPHGHTIDFKKGVLTHVPKEAWAAVTAVGAIPESELPEDEVQKNDEPADPGERKEQIFAAFTQLVEKNERESFTGTGAPTGKAVSDIVGFSVDAKERDTLWAEFRQLGADA